MPQAHTRVTEVSYFPLQAGTDVTSALHAALTIGYRGSVSAYMDGGVEVWSIELNGPGNPQPVKGCTGDVFVWNGSSLLSMPEVDFLARYTPVV